jgi:large subunit ribosomal protein L25
MWGELRPLRRIAHLDTKLSAERRTVLGKQVKRLRREGLVPANMYGQGRDSVALQLPARDVAMRLARASRSTLFNLELDGTSGETVLIKQLQRHPTSGQVLHVDLFRVAMDEKLRTTVPLQFTGEAAAVKEFNGTLMLNLDSVEVEALPRALPSSIEVDLSPLAGLDDSVQVADLQVPSGVQILTPADHLVARVLPPRVMEEAEVAEAPAEAEAGAAAAPAEDTGVEATSGESEQTE